MNKFIISFIITFIAGISTLIGGVIPFLKFKNKERVILSSLAFAAGIMVSISVLDLIPESFFYLRDYASKIGLILISFFGGVLVFFILDKFLIEDIDNLYRVGIFSMIAIIIHNIPEGIITFVLSSTDIRLGLFLGLSIAFHNIPEGISVMVPIYYGTRSFKKAFFFTLIAGLAEVIGGVLFYLLFNNYINNFLLGMLFSFISGVMIYLSFTELLPKSLEYNDEKRSLFFFLIGILFFLVISIFMH